MNRPKAQKQKHHPKKYRRRDSLADYFKGFHLPPDARPLKLLGVDYVHVRTTDGGDLYVTKYGIPLLDHLKPENWREDPWFEANREALEGTSTIYKVPTKEINGRALDLVVKWCRVGEHVPMDTLTFNRFVEVEFNSPYEEFSLVMEMRARAGPDRIRTHRPLAIYVPAKRLKLWQTGRSKSKMARKKAKFQDVELDIYRQYILIYEWVKGVDAVVGFQGTTGKRDKRARELKSLTKQVNKDLSEKGFAVLDQKPAHFIVRPQPDGTMLKDRSGRLAYALVDFELLTRTPEHEHEVHIVRRADYHKGQRDPFKAPRRRQFPEHLHPVSVHKVNYIYGHAESTHGVLWVVGRHPELFDYFLPERWRRTPRKQLSTTNQTFWTLSKDNINLVWKVSRVGERPDVPARDEHSPRIIEYGYNSPFEEFAIALELSAKGIKTVYPRAIYMTGLESDRAADYISDNSRYESHKRIATPDNTLALRSDRNYLTIWGYWNGLDEVLARKDQVYCEGIDLRHARKNGFITESDMHDLMQMKSRKLADAGFEDLDLKPTHFLLSLQPDRTLMLDDEGQPAVRICNFELIRRLEATDT